MKMSLYANFIGPVGCSLGWNEAVAFSLYAVALKFGLLSIRIAISINYSWYWSSNVWIHKSKLHSQMSPQSSDDPQKFIFCIDHSYIWCSLEGSIHHGNGMNGHLANGDNTQSSRPSLQGGEKRPNLNRPLMFWCFKADWTCLTASQSQMSQQA